ncbi:hypothetical protein J7M23_01725 [Candidatus Sumerlaeota bacterium]|nr:hypothetical protein [Candidatus Sumerlaeota bacterium]
MQNSAQITDNREALRQELFKVIALFFIGFGLLIIIFAIRHITTLITESIASLLGGTILFRHYPIYTFSVVGKIIGAVILGSGILVYLTRKEWVVNLSLLIFIVSMVVLVDRVLFIVYGSGLWMYDPVTYYKHRPNTIGNWRIWGPQFTDKLIYINEYGHYDDSFPEEKGKNELRGANDWGFSYYGTRSRKTGHVCEPAGAVVIYVLL